mgnify:CR=1 FL=1
MLRVLFIHCLCVCLAAAQTGPADRPEDPPAEAGIRRDIIVVTGTYTPVPLDEADRAVSVFPLDTEDRLLSNSVVDSLKLDSSVDVRQRGPNNIQGDLSIRGSTFGQTLVLVDGFRLNDAQSGHHNLDLPVAIDSLERIEVLKGSGSAFYGSDAVGGVVNFMSRKPEVSEFRLRAGVGNQGANQQRASISLLRGALSEQITFYRDFSSGFIPNRDYRNLSVASRTGFDTRLGYSRILLAHSDRPFGAEQFYGRFNSWERTKGWFAAATQPLGGRTDISFAYRRHTDLFVLYRDRPQVFTNHHAVESYQAIVRRWEPLGANGRFHYGAEGLREAIDSNNLGGHRRSRGAAYAAADLRVMNRFSFTLGGRLETYGSVNTEFNPTAAGGVWLSSQLKLRASVSRAFRLPAFTDLYYHDPANRGSPDLRPESAWGFETGLDWNAGGRLRAEVSFFHRRERDGIDFVRASPDDLWRATNFQKLNFSGVEAAVTTIVARRHRFGFRYTALDGQQDLIPGFASRYVFNYPRHSGIAGWQAALPGGWVARSRLGVLQRYQRASYAVWDVYVARAAGRIHPFVQLTNLTATSYEEIAGVIMPGRGILGGVEIALFSSGK